MCASTLTVLCSDMKRQLVLYAGAPHAKRPKKSMLSSTKNGSDCQNLYELVKRQKKTPATSKKQIIFHLIFNSDGFFCASPFFTIHKTLNT